LALAKNILNYFETLVSRFLRRSRRQRTPEASYHLQSMKQNNIPHRISWFGTIFTAIQLAAVLASSNALAGSATWNLNSISGDANCDTLRFRPMSLRIRATPFDIKTADLNGDGKLDLAILPDNELLVSLGDGRGRFSSPLAYDQGGFLTLLTFGDFNGDGFPDIVVVDFPGIDVLLNDGAGGFPTTLFINTGPEPAGVAVADFNGDGKLDIAVSDFQLNSVSFLAGDGAGGFAAPVSFATGTSPSRIVAGDFDGDNVPDLAVAEYGSMDLRIFKGSGDGQFTRGAIYPLGGNAEGLVTTDFNNDGNLDLAVNVFNIFPNNHVAVFLGSGSGTFAQSASIPGDVFWGLAAADLNNDGNADVAFPGAAINVALGDGTGGFCPVQQIPFGDNAGGYPVAAGDLNTDGRSDLVGSVGRAVIIFLNRTQP
jgi:hypothetical protein